MSILLDSMRTIFSTKQKEGESLQDYTKRFRVAREVLKSHIGGPIAFPKVVESIKGYKKQDPDTESQIITATIEAKQLRDFMTADVPNAFVQTEFNKKVKGQRIMMKTREHVTTNCSRDL